jgi:hypothetical protein
VEDAGVTAKIVTDAMKEKNTENTNQAKSEIDTAAKIL